mmetsp:Transcript_23003/g.48926  ORF Transcript_23003/g.48926 Transcript_23003/m.48926 type:complete len:285 (+) Transcript_23003:40-894(+)
MTKRGLAPPVVCHCTLSRKGHGFSGRRCTSGSSPYIRPSKRLDSESQSRALCKVWVQRLPQQRRARVLLSDALLLGRAAAGKPQFPDSPLPLGAMSPLNSPAPFSSAMTLLLRPQAARRPSQTFPQRLPPVPGWRASLPETTGHEPSVAVGARAPTQLRGANGARGATASAKTRSKTAKTSAPDVAAIAGMDPVPGGNGAGGAVSSAAARRLSRYHWAARVLYFSRIGKSSGTPCSLRNSVKRWFPPSSIILMWSGVQASMVVDCTKLTLTPKLRWTPAASMLR